MELEGGLFSHCGNILNLLNFVYYLIQLTCLALQLHYAVSGGDKPLHELIADHDYTQE